MYIYMQIVDDYSNFLLSQAVDLANRWSKRRVKPQFASSTQIFSRRML
jgi:hypothetical protein